jgi:hypothetical protein
MKSSSAALRQYLQDRYPSSQEWPTNLYDAIATFCEIEIEDNEHHILIAASKVGRSPSLLQEAVSGRLPAEVNKGTAVEMLRDMAEDKRRSARDLLGT